MLRKKKLTTSWSRPDLANIVQFAVVILIVGWAFWVMLYREGMRRWDEYLASHDQRAQYAHMVAPWNDVPPRPSRYVTDTAHVIESAAAQRINEMLAAFERDTSNQVLVYVAPSMPFGATIEQVASDAFNTWRIGQKGRDNGALFLVFVGDREMRIEVGYGLEGVLTDAKAKRILENVVKPFFKRDAYSEGVEAGARAIVDVVRNEGNAGDGQTAAERAALMGIAAKGFGLRAIGFVIVMTFLGFALFAASLVFIALERTVRSGNRKFAGSGAKGSWSGGSNSRSSSSSSSSSRSSSSSFSGGGGRSGGGGASSSW